MPKGPPERTAGGRGGHELLVAHRRHLFHAAPGEHVEGAAHVHAAAQQVAVAVVRQEVVPLESL